MNRLATLNYFLTLLLMCLNGCRAIWCDDPQEKTVAILWAILWVMLAVLATLHDYALRSYKP